MIEPPGPDLRQEGRPFRDAWAAWARIEPLSEPSIRELERLDGVVLAEGVPEALFEVDDDEAPLADFGARPIGERRWFGHVDSLSELRQAAATHPRASEILAAHDAWAREKGMAEPTRAWSDAWTANSDVNDAWMEAFGALMSAEAVTLDALLVKAAVAHQDGGGVAGGLAGIERRIQSDRDKGLDPLFETVAARDLLRLAIARGVSVEALLGHGGPAPAPAESGPPSNRGVGPLKAVTDLPTIDRSAPVGMPARAAA